MCVTPVSAEQAAVETIRGCLISFYICWKQRLQTLCLMLGPTEHVMVAASYTNAVIHRPIRSGSGIGCVQCSKFRFAADNSPLPALSKSEIGWAWTRKRLSRWASRPDAVHMSGQKSLSTRNSAKTPATRRHYGNAGMVGSVPSMSASGW